MCGAVLDCQRTYLCRDKSALSHGIQALALEMHVPYESTLLVAMIRSSMLGRVLRVASPSRCSMRSDRVCRHLSFAAPLSVRSHAMSALPASCTAEVRAEQRVLLHRDAMQ